MAKYIGYVTVPHDTYIQWRLNTNGNGYDVDHQYGCQCWDFASLFWWNVGFPTNYPIITSSSAYTMWDHLAQNSTYNGVTYFDIITNINDVKRGDVMVFNYTGSNPYGHVGFADEDFATWTPPSDPSQRYEFPILSENNGGFPDPEGGAYTNVHGYDYRLFRGAFRYRGWETTPPTPTVTEKAKRTHFPWVLYARKLRAKRR